MSSFGPKKERPVRESVKNIAIEKGLKVAAEQRSGGLGRLKVGGGGGVNKKRLQAGRYILPDN